MKTVEEIKDFLLMSKKAVRAISLRPGIKAPEAIALNEQEMTLQMIIDWLSCETLDEN